MTSIFSPQTKYYFMICFLNSNCNGACNGLICGLSVIMQLCVLQVFVLMQFDPGMEYRPGWGDGNIIFNAVQNTFEGVKDM